MVVILGTNFAPYAICVGRAAYTVEAEVSLASKVASLPNTANRSAQTSSEPLICAALKAMRRPPMATPPSWTGWPSRHGNAASFRSAALAPVLNSGDASRAMAR